MASRNRNDGVIDSPYPTGLLARKLAGLLARKLARLLARKPAVGRGVCAAMLAGGLGVLMMAGPVSAQCESEELVSNDITDFDRFGNAVDIDGDTLVVGAFLADENGQNSGAAYVFEHDGEAWNQTAKLVGNDTVATDHFGFSVAISGDVIVVGADLHNDSANDTGAAYVFRKSGDVWVQEAKLVPVDAEFNDKFGSDVDISGDLVIVGALDEDTNGSNAGAAYVFSYDGAQWEERQKLLASDGEAVDKFGRSVAIDDTAPFGPVALVASYFADSSAGNNTGAVYSYRLIDDVWVEDGLLLTAITTNPGDQFGASVAVCDDLAVIGSNLQDEAGANSGAAYLFADNSADWVQVHKFLPEDGGVGDEFGYAVAIDGTQVAIGAPNHADQGAVYIYEYDTKQREWIFVTKAEQDLSNADRYGVSVAFDAARGLFGADQRDTGGDNSGAIFIFNGFSGEDCDDDGVPDVCEDDKNENGIPDDCENDCNSNGIDDAIDLADCMGEAWCDDCNNNGVLDECDITDGTEADCDGDGIPDSCQIADDPSLDCNENGVLDSCDIESGDSDDCNDNDIPDDCEVEDCVDDVDCLDCNENGVMDACDIADETEQDCNENGIPDSCDIAADPGLDINENGVIDGCDEDCNNNNLPDFLEIGFDPNLDQNDNGIIDSCEDCNTNGVPDFQEIAKGDAQDCNENGLPDECDLVEQDGEPPVENDCNGNGVPDSCDIEAGDEEDEDGNGVPDSCQDCDGNGTPDFTDLADCDGEPDCDDCDGNGILDVCDIEDGTLEDCNENGIPDQCDLENGTSTDFNDNDIPDECENADCNNNGVSDVLDILIGTSDDLNENGLPDECEADIDGDGAVNVSDLLSLLANWGTCADPCPPSCPGDLGNGNHPMDCSVDVADLLMLLAQWTTEP